MRKLINQPFEQTFRLQVNLPHNQRMVLRVSPRTTLAELKLQICNERELEYGNHDLVHPAQPNVLLDLNGTLGNYGCAEISIMSRSAHDSTSSPSSFNLTICPRVDDEKRKRGILRLFSRKKKEITTDVKWGTYNHFTLLEKNTDIYENNHSKHSNKRKPAPAPPVVIQQVSSSVVIQKSSLIASQQVAKFDELGSLISHSRHSSDSSGYHESSVFSDCSENKSPEIPVSHDNLLSENCSTYCKDTSSHHISKRHLSTNSRIVPPCSSIPISTIIRKRKAPLPPISILSDSETPSDDKSMKSILVNVDVTTDQTKSCTISSDQLECSDFSQKKEIDGLQDFPEVQKLEENYYKSIQQSDSSDSMPDESQRAVTESSSISTQSKSVVFDFNHYNCGRENERQFQVSCQSNIKRQAESATLIENIAFDNKSDIDTGMCIKNKDNVIKKKPSVRIVPFSDRNSTKPNSYGIKTGNVQKRCNELSSMNIFPLAGRATSLYNLTKNISERVDCISPYASEPSIDSCDEQNFEKKIFNHDREYMKLITPEKFYVEYIKLQEKFLSWQKQLENNQDLLKNEIISKTSQLEISKQANSEAPTLLQKSIESYSFKDISESLSKQEGELLPSDAKKLALLPSSSKFYTTNNSKSATQHITDREPSTEMSKYSVENVCVSNKSELSKSQTFPRSSSHLTCFSENQQTMTLNRKVKHKSHAISVSIGSWLQRNEPAEDIGSMSVASSRSKFHSLENIPMEHGTLSSMCHQNGTSFSEIPAANKYLAQINKGSSPFLYRFSEVGTMKLNENFEGTDAIMKVTKKLMKNEKKQIDCATLRFSKPTKPFVRISSMKDELLPPPLHALKKWPFPEIHENALNVKKYNVQETVNVSSKWSSLEHREKIIRAEVDLRKPRVANPQMLNNSSSSNESSGIGNDLHDKKLEKCDLEKCKISSNEVSQQLHSISEAILKQAVINTVEVYRDPTYEEAGDNSSSNQNNKPHLFVNGDNSPPPPPPISTIPPIHYIMPTIPPAVAIPKSSLLIKDNNKKTIIPVKSENLMTKLGKDPREELMLEIRGFGGRQALRKCTAAITRG